MEHAIKSLLDIIQFVSGLVVNIFDAITFYLPVIDIAKQLNRWTENFNLCKSLLNLK